jgi:hypothetical protein
MTRPDEFDIDGVDLDARVGVERPVTDETNRWADRLTDATLAWTDRLVDRSSAWDAS